MELLKSKDVKELNFNDVAFFLNISVTDAKWKIAPHVYTPETIENNLTTTGIPKISVKDVFSKELFDQKIKSCSHLEGKSLIDYTVETYNHGVSLTKLKEYSENKTFIKALYFTGKYSILNKILNKDQLKKVQKHWVLKNTYLRNTWSENCIKFIESNKWVFDYLVAYNITEIDLETQIKKLQSVKQ